MVEPVTETANPPDQKTQQGDAPDPKNTEAKAFISWWQDRILSAIKFHEPSYKMMYQNSRFIRGDQWGEHTDKFNTSSAGSSNTAAQLNKKYVVNVVQSEVMATVSALYAKNPTFTVERKPRMDFEIWDENIKSLQEAQLAVQEAFEAGEEISPDVLALLEDVNKGKQQRIKLDRIARTLELVFDQQILQQDPDFKREMKQLIRRIETHSVGYLKLDFQRLEELNPEAATRYADVTSRIAHIEANMAGIPETERDDKSKQIEDLRISLKTLKEQTAVVSKEGLLINFPRTPSVIIDTSCSQIRGFVGARWLAEEFYLSRQTIFEVYNVDVGAKAKAFDRSSSAGFSQWKMKAKNTGGDSKRDFDDLFRVWEVYHKETGSTFTICEGCDVYLREPAAPKILLERFFPYYPLSFNDIEDDECIYPVSTVEALRHPQKEVNRAKEALRQHRIASKPQYAVADGALSETDITNLSTLETHGVVSLQGLGPGQSVDALLQQIKKHGIDPNVYETSTFFEDMNRITRTSGARMGAASKVTATADSIAEDSRQVEDRSKSDDIDDFLTEFARDAGNTLLLQLSPETAREIAGVGALWPAVRPEELLRDLALTIEAGSSGRPNQALEVSKFQRLFPILVQTPGINPSWLAKKAIAMADANIDLSEAYIEDMPSIQAINAAAIASLNAEAAAGQPGTGNPDTDPAAQGQEGANPVPRPPGQDQSLTANTGLNGVPASGVGNTGRQ